MGNECSDPFAVCTKTLETCSGENEKCECASGYLNDGNGTCHFTGKCRKISDDKCVFFLILAEINRLFHPLMVSFFFIFNLCSLLKLIHYMKLTLLNLRKHT